MKQPNHSCLTHYEYFYETGQTLRRVLTDGDPGTGTPDPGPLGNGGHAD